MSLRPNPRRHILAGLAGIALAAASAFTPRSTMPSVSALEIEALVPLRGAEAPLRPWRVVDGTQWQLEAQESEAVADDEADAQESDPERGDCPAGMVEVRGAMKQNGRHGTVEDLQTLSCSEWVDHPEPHSCNAFEPVKWAALARDLPTRAMRFCIDRYEYPDRAGQYPLIMVDWDEAATHCAARGRRLCTEDEWTFACEGPEARPYANGFVRDGRACVIDRPWRFVDFQVFAGRTGPRIEREIDALWQGEPAGSHRACRSPFGAFDMTGNVDEWTVTSRSEGLRSILKGGYWGPVHARCRGSTRVHNEWFYFYQIGFRCCAAVPSPMRDGSAEGEAVGAAGDDSDEWSQRDAGGQ